MSESKHTPGPWHYEDGPLAPENSLFLGIMGPDNHGMPHAMAFENFIQGGDMWANARLIAASPVLYSFVVKAAHSGNKKAKATLDTLGLGY